MKSWIFSKLKGFAPQIFFSRAVAEILLTHVRPRDFMDHWSVQPFNGQIVRHKTIAKIIEDFKPTICIETGTYLGSSTPYLASYANAPTYTIEIEKETYEKARKIIAAKNIKNISKEEYYKLCDIDNRLSTEPEIIYKGHATDNLKSCY